MDTRQLRENRAAFPEADLAKYRGQWVAFSMAGRRIVAGAPDLVELDTLLLAMGKSPEQVGSARIHRYRREFRPRAGDRLMLSFHRHRADYFLLSCSRLL